jgi:anion-transporting  ArsA/GET3 family ATPase
MMAGAERESPPPRLIVVTGKGGVGKSSVAAALGLVAAQSGRGTLLVEVAGRSDVASALGAGATAAGEERALDDRLWHFSVQPRVAMEDYLRNELPGRFVGALLNRSAAFNAFAMAAPGLRELVTIGKVWELTQRPRRRAGARQYDRVILDAPASGNALGLLAAPRTFASVARIGPVARQADAIDRAIRDPRFTAVVAVGAPEQTAVSETLALTGRLRDELGVDLRCAVMNGMLPARFTAAELRALQPLAADPAVRCASAFGTRARAQRAQLGRLRRGIQGTPVRALPLVIGSDPDGEHGRRLVAALARGLS